VVKDCKPALFGVFPLPMFFQWLLDLVVSSEWFLQSLKLCAVMAFAGVPFLCCISNAFFKLRWTTNNRTKKMARELFDVILFSSCHLCQVVLLYLQLFSSIRIRYETQFWCLSQKKEITIVRLVALINQNAPTG
jgi:hypothetical protein